jgi:hypothetical protein
MWTSALHSDPLIIDDPESTDDRLALEHRDDHGEKADSGRP